MAQRTTAGLVVIGNEILSGKVEDSNSSFLARQLRDAGVSLERMHVIPDEVEVIASSVREFHDAYDVVFTSGGVGPTHDDVTIAGVARALDRKVVRHPELERSLRELFKGEVSESQLRLADVVEGTELIFEGSMRFPTFCVDNIYVLPGIPEIFRDKAAAVVRRFRTDPFHLRVVYSREPETAIAAALNRTLELFPELMLGSYPKLHDTEYRVRITLESKDSDYVERALAELLQLLPPHAVVRHE